MESSTQANAPPYSVRVALRLGWLFLISVLIIKLWPYWRAAAAVFPEGTNWLARIVALLFATFFLMFTPELVGQLVTAVCLVFLARRQAWARMVFLAGAAASIMAVIAEIVDKHEQPSVVLLYIQLLLVLLQGAFATLLFRGDASDWFRSRRASRSRQ